MRFSENLQKFRKKSELTQQELANQVGVSRQAIAAYEAKRREPSLAVLLRLSGALKITTDQLIGTEEFAIGYYDEIIKRNLKVLIGCQSIEEFCYKVGKKTGFIIDEELLSQCLEGKSMLNPVFLKIIAMYVEKNVEIFYDEKGFETTIKGTLKP